MNYFVYIVRGKDKSLYTGSTVNIQRRINEHNFSNKGAKAVKGKLPVVLVHWENFKTRGEALKREAEIKSWKKDKKEDLIAQAKLAGVVHR